MALHDTKHSNVRRTRRKQKGVRRERLNFTEGPKFEKAESEPGSQPIMSAAWVERMARNPVLQEIMARGLEETGFDPAGLTQFDITVWLEGLDLAQRREIISDIAVVEAQTAEINRRFAELHANDQFPAGG